MKADYMLLHDMDGSPCITQRKEKVHQKSNTCEEDNIQIVVQEIESWYIAGLDENSCALLKLSPVKTTNTLTKEQFNQIIPFQFQRTDFMVEVLKQFSLDTAVTKNNSFRYFTLKYHLLSET
ncbi:MAG: hypothetical protein GY796_02945 [Chloroflexi bacterium]|nr:hypothetical protein [Chloroflexota bacterium]